MSSGIALTAIMLAICSVHTGRANITWATNTCPINITENTSKETLNTFQVTSATNYTILNQTVNGRFSIASSTGILSSTTALDYESDQKSYSLEIKASNADDSEHANLACLIRVIDVNDNPPKFAKKAYSVDTFNNVAIDTTVLRVKAIDGDVSEAFKKIVYRIKDEENRVNFTINVNTGDIRAKTVLNAAVPRNLTLKVVATDNNFTAEASVRVCVGCKTSGSSSPQLSLFVYAVLIFGVVLV